MVTIEIDYAGELRTRSVHGPSHQALVTDAPLDNHGRGESFSPTDLLATALGTCMLTVMGIAAGKSGVDISGARARVRKHMSPAPRRVARLEVDVQVPAARARGIDAEQRAALEQAAETCPVRLSLAPATEVVTRYAWDDAG